MGSWYEKIIIYPYKLHTEMSALTLIGFIIRVLPSVTSSLLALFKFNYTMLIRGIEANHDHCPDYHNAENGNWICFKSGSTASSIVTAALSLAMSVLIISHLSEKRPLMEIGLFWGVILIFISFGYSFKYHSELFTVTNGLRSSDVPLFRFFGNHLAFFANAVALIGSVGFQYYALIF